ncbi:DoxX family protein [Nocardia sp. NPDC004123]
MDTGLLLIRVLLGVVMFTHGTQKALGWFNGPGPEAAAALFEKLGQRPGKVTVWIAVTCELISALLMGLGLLSPLGAAISASTMIAAGFSLNHLSGNFWNAAGGGEYPIVLAIAALALGFTGPGRYSVDFLLPLPWAISGTAQTLTGFAVISFAFSAAAVPIASLRRSRADVVAGS